MIIFNHNLIFKNEKVVQNTIFSDSLPAILIVEKSDGSLLNTFSLKTSWTLMSGQQARYCSAKLFREADKYFSWALEIKDVVTLIWDAKERTIFYMRRKNYTPKRLQFWIYHTFFPLVLELQKKYHILHVGSIEINDKPVLFSAFSFGGKSTLTDYFIQQGHTMLSDDSLGIEKKGEEYYAIASYPFHRPYREFEVLGYPVKNFSTGPKPIHAVYLLEKSEPDAIIEIIEAKGIEKFKAFHFSSFINFDFMKQEWFEFFTEMAKHVPVYKVNVPWNLERLDEVYEAIVENSQS